MATPWDSPVGKDAEEIIFSIIRENCPCQTSNVRLLDFGAGNGRYLEMLNKQMPKGNLYGTEVDKERVAQIAQKGFNVVLLEEGRDCLPYEDDFFDVVFSSNVIEHIPESIYKRYLLEINRVLKEKGLFIVGTPNYPAKRFYDMYKALRTGFFKYYFFDDPTHINKLSFKSLESDLKTAFGFVDLWPTYILFENRLKFLQRKDVRQKLRFLGDKIMGFCVKK